MKSLIKLYDDMSEEVKNNLRNILLVQVCKEYDEDIDNDTIETIVNLSNECWLHDEYTRAGADDYAYYLLDEIYNNKLDIQYLASVDKWDIIQAFNDHSSIRSFAKTKPSDMEYILTTKDDNKYYASDDGIYITNSKDFLVHEPHPMEDSEQIIFDLFKNNLVKYMPLSSHLGIRNIIKKEIYGDESLEEKYKEGIENYKKYCKERFITSRDILRVTKSKENIDIMEEDKIYTDEEKLKRLDNVISKLSCKDINKYTYVASYESGVDFYYANNKYVAINNDNIVKEFEDKDLLLLNELQLNDKFSYISEDESKKIADYLISECKNEKIDEKWYEKNTSYSLRSYLKYENDKELDSFTNEKILLMYVIASSNPTLSKELQKVEDKNIKNSKDNDLEM